MRMYVHKRAYSVLKMGENSASLNYWNWMDSVVQRDFVISVGLIYHKLLPFRPIMSPIIFKLQYSFNLKNIVHYIPAPPWLEVAWKEALNTFWNDFYDPLVRPSLMRRWSTMILHKCKHKAGMPWSRPTSFIKTHTHSRKYFGSQIPISIIKIILYWLKMLYQKGDMI